MTVRALSSPCKEGQGDKVLKGINVKKQIQAQIGQDYLGKVDVVMWAKFCKISLKVLKK